LQPQVRILLLRACLSLGKYNWLKSDRTRGNMPCNGPPKARTRLVEEADFFRVFRVFRGQNWSTKGTKGTNQVSWGSWLFSCVSCFSWTELVHERHQRHEPGYTEQSDFFRVFVGCLGL